MKFSIRIFTLIFAAVALLTVALSYYPSSYSQEAYDKYHESVIAMYQETDAQLQQFANKKISRWSSESRQRSVYMTFIEIYEAVQKLRIHR